MSFSRVTHPVARKPHDCLDCDRRIEPGERYARIVWAEYGRLGTEAVCLHCHVAALAIGARDDLFWEEMLWGGLHAALPFADGRAIDDLDVISLCRLEVGFRRAWRRRDGTLMPVPDLARGQRIAFLDEDRTVWRWLPSLGGLDAVRDDGSRIGPFDFLEEAERAAGAWGRAQPHQPDRCDPARGLHSQPHRGCLAR